MNTYRIKFYQLIEKNSEVEIEADSEENAMAVFYDDFHDYEALSTLLSEDLLEVDIDEIIRTYIDEE